jgi:hypothetical protein
MFGKSNADQESAEARRTGEAFPSARPSNGDAMAATFVFRLRIRTG